VHGALSWPATFASVTIGAMVGAVIDWRVGRALGVHLGGRAATRGPLEAQRFARFEASYRRHGPWLLAANRFMPGVRAFLFVAAGAARVPLREVLLFGGVSAAAWNAVLLAAGALIAHNLAEMNLLFERYTVASTLVLALVAALALALAIARRRARGAVE
jgi:membrane-associated protein